ncbi:MAG: single-stranded DNA-binding protein [Nocardioides sp.]|jgi:single-strand DNA-binding protein|uniref:single-stranded DNA-binding protein n=1 Tax=Nocardioides sp. TaxID=35761 RepID=UPI002384B1B7|nr:single-stranded DNA-binding protein [Nocardioides sp.]MDE0778678.1 single-stranded DNA-binding protein [Nocardioides sp.]
MPLPTQMSLHGFIATAPALNFTSKGSPRFYARIGVEQFRKEVDNSFTKLDSTFHDLVMFDRAAEHAYAQFKVGDEFVASGYVHEYEVERRGRREIREQFIARCIGHDCSRTRYAVDRPSRQLPPGQTAQASPANEPPRLIGI